LIKTLVLIFVALGVSTSITSPGSGFLSVISVTDCSLLMLRKQFTSTLSVKRLGSEAVSRSCAVPR
jgi:hypothetical protein